jgi:hypothetical protein
MSPHTEEYPFSLEKGQPPDPPETDTPLVVDLDGTLIYTDLLVESFLALIKQTLCTYSLLFSGPSRERPI